ncbi:MAG: phytanoyl-CoA dioxygenase family protein [Chloroflexota bacterium]
MDWVGLNSDLEEKGFAVIRGLLSQKEADDYVHELEKLSNISRRDFSKKSQGSMLEKRGLNTNFNLPDGVVKSKAFWPLITHPNLLEHLHRLVDPEVKFLQHNDLHVGFSAISWHRDNINRRFGVGSDWASSAAPYKLVRIGIYLQSYEESKFRLGFIPGSHKPPQGEVTFARRLNEQKLAWIGAASYLSVRMQERASNAEWVATNPGDAILFDPRVLHSGSYIQGPKYSIFLAFGVENQHFYNHYNYYRRIRSELGYGEFDPALSAILKEYNLLQHEYPKYDSIPDAWTPPPVLKNALARRFKM